MKNFRTVLSGIDPAPLLKQIADRPDLWNNDPELQKSKEFTALYAVNNITLRRIMPPSGPGNPPFRNFDAFYVLSEARRIVFDVMRAVEGEILSQVIISRMRDNEVIQPHIDYLPPGVPLSFQRFQVPLAVKPGVVFVCGDEQLYMEPGHAYWFDNQVRHSVYNNSGTDRISMRIDIRPFGEF